MLASAWFRLALIIRRLSIWAYRMSELPERFLAGIAVATLLVVTLVVWPPGWSGGEPKTESGDS